MLVYDKYPSVEGKLLKEKISLEEGVEIVKYISKQKNEPEWMLEWRLKAFNVFNKLKKPDWAKLKAGLIAMGREDIFLIEDSADTVGYTFNNQNLGKYSDITTNSMYASHIITGAGSGGIVCFNDYKLYKKAKLLRGWGRSSATFNESESIEKRFNVKISGIDYDAKYVFSEMGYNFLPSEISAVFALEQLKKLGCSCDWDRTKFTLDDDMYESVIQAFEALHEKGLVYRGYRMINWDPEAKTTVSDEEVNHIEFTEIKK